jgi:hypothetical protein
VNVNNGLQYVEERDRVLEGLKKTMTRLDCHKLTFMIRERSH